MSTSSTNSLLSNNLDELPQDLLWFIGIKLGCRSLIHFTQSSLRLYQLFGQTEELTKMLRLKLQGRTQMDLTHFTKEELGLFYRIKKKKARIAAGAGFSLALNPRGKSMFLEIIMIVSWGWTIMKISIFLLYSMTLSLVKP